MSSLTEVRHHRKFIPSFDNNGEKTATYYKRYKGGYGFLVERYTKEQRLKISAMKDWLELIIYRLEIDTDSSPENALHTLKMYFDACMSLSTFKKENPTDKTSIDFLRLDISVRETYETLNSLTPIDRNRFRL